MKKVNSILVTAVLGSFLLLSGCGQPDKYAAEAIFNFVSTCADQGDLDVKACACLIDHMRENLPYKEFVIGDAKMQRSNEMPDNIAEHMANAAISCT